MRLRAHAPLVAARVRERPGGFAVRLAEPVHGVARGQTAVLYEGDAVVGAGTIGAVSV
jgi:tRNA-specific 2-thiouridylase